jgi:protein-disulfide isomerase
MSNSTPTDIPSAADRRSKSLVLAAVALSLVALGLSTVALLFSLGLLKGGAASVDFDQQTRDYIMANPETIVEAVNQLEARQKATEENELTALIFERRDEIFSDAASPVAGNPKGDITLVEFFDYNCPYCRAAGPTVTELLQGNPDVRFVYKEFPTLAPSSRFAAQAALAARRQSPELYTAFHDALMKAKGRLAEDGVLQIAREAGINVDRMRADMKAPTINESLDRNIELAHAIGITGTPTFIIGDAMLVGSKPLAEMESAIADARSTSTSSQKLVHRGVQKIHPFGAWHHQN